MSIGTETGRRRRRRLRLTPMRSIPVEFTGERAGEGPLTLGQLNVYAWVYGAPDDLYATLRVELPVPEVVFVDDVAEATAVLITRHESLRTTYVAGEQPRQRVAGAGVQLLEVCSLGEGQWGPQDRPAVAEALIQWLRESPDPTRRPVRLAVAIAPDMGDRVIACAAGFSHLAVDHDAIEILKRDFAGLLGDPVRRHVGRPGWPGRLGWPGRSDGPLPGWPDRSGWPDRPGRSGHQPLDQAELEATPAERRKAEAALDYLREQSRRMPRWLYALPGARASGESLVVELSSVAAAMAVRRVAARTRASRSSIVLAAICAVIARRASYGELVLPVPFSNRFERHLVNYVGALAQSSIATVEIGGRSFDELVGHVWTRVMEANRHARYDMTKRAAMDDLTEHERGLRFDYGPLFNSLVPESWSVPTAGAGFAPEEIDAALAGTELRWRPMPTSGTPIRFTLNQIDGGLRLDVWSGDAGLVPRAELESVLLAVERLLVAAAHGDVPGGRMPEVIGLEPLPGTPDRILVDHCWVDVADVQRLVDDAIGSVGGAVGSVGGAVGGSVDDGVGSVDGAVGSVGGAVGSVDGAVGSVDDGVGPAVARVFASAGGRPLVAYMTATDAVRTPEQAHDRCMAVLERHPTAITPRYYVICGTAPSDPADPAAWPAPLAAGSGRTRTVPVPSPDPSGPGHTSYERGDDYSPLAQ